MLFYVPELSAEDNQKAIEIKEKFQIVSKITNLPLQDVRSLKNEKHILESLDKKDR